MVEYLHGKQKVTGSNPVEGYISLIEISPMLLCYKNERPFLVDIKLKTS